MEEVNVTLSREQLELLNYLLGLASGVAIREESPTLRRSIYRLANHVNRDNDHWTPFAIPEEIENSL